MSAKNYDLDFNGYWRTPYIDSMPAQSGIYCVYACIYDANAKTVDLKRLLYIGEAADVRGRVANHEKRQEWEGKLKSGEVLCFNAALISPATDRERAEAAMVNHHKPPCNTTYVNSFPFDQTTIATSGRNALLTANFTVMMKKAVA
jgi:excinuclease UvrABC nuclease subunit